MTFLGTSYIGTSIIQEFSLILRQLTVLFFMPFMQPALFKALTFGVDSAPCHLIRYLL